MNLLKKRTITCIFTFIMAIILCFFLYNEYKKHSTVIEPWKKLRFKKILKSVKDSVSNAISDVAEEADISDLADRASGLGSGLIDTATSNATGIIASGAAVAAAATASDLAGTVASGAAGAAGDIASGTTGVAGDIASGTTDAAGALVDIAEETYDVFNLNFASDAVKELANTMQSISDSINYLGNSFNESVIKFKNVIT